nr:MAG TPA: hypothetical protein [Caudoviricetes sp.]
MERYVVNIYRKRLSALILDCWKFSQNFTLCQGLSNGRCPWICNICFRHDISGEILSGSPDYIYKRGLLRCRPTEKGNARSLQQKDGNRYRFLRFFL